MNNSIFDKIYKTIIVVMIAFVIYQLYALKESTNNGRYKPFGQDNNLIIDTRTGKIIESIYY